MRTPRRPSLLPWRIALGVIGVTAALVARFVSDRPAPAASPQVVPARAAASTAAAPSVPKAPASAVSALVPAPVAPVAPAITSEQIMAEARIRGDRRAPPIDPPDPQPEPPTPWELADPAQYQARQQRLDEEMKARYVQASEQRLSDLRAAIATMRAQGATPEQLARADDKVAHLQAVHDAIVRGESLAASAPMR